MVKMPQLELMCSSVMTLDNAATFAPIRLEGLNSVVYPGEEWCMNTVHDGELSRSSRLSTAGWVEILILAPEYQLQLRQRVHDVHAQSWEGYQEDERYASVQESIHDLRTEGEGRIGHDAAVLRIGSVPEIVTMDHLEAQTLVLGPQLQ